MLAKSTAYLGLSPSQMRPVRVENLGDKVVSQRMIKWRNLSFALSS